MKIDKGFFKLLFLGFIVGIASIMPGMSGGILAIALGIYEPALSAVVNIKSQFKKSIFFLFPLVIGAGIGIIIFGLIMKPLLQSFETSIIYFFIGLVIGSLPSYLKTATKDGFRIMYIVPFLISFSIGITLAGAVESNIKTDNLTPLLSLISGGVLSLGMVVPGISSSFILLQLGVYEKIISSFLAFDFYYIFFIALGFIIVSILTIKLINTAFNKYHGYAYFTALGFLLSSVVSVFPGIRGGFNLITDIFLLIIGLIIVYTFMRKNKKG